MPSIKWPAEPVEGYLQWDREEYRDGSLYFMVEDQRFVIPVTQGSSFTYNIDLGVRTVYHVEVTGIDITITPGIKIKDITSPNPARFKQRQKRQW